MTALFQPFPMLPGRRAQVWHHHPSFRRPRHFHSEPELNVVTRGMGVLSVGDRRLEVRPGDAVLLQPGQEHELLAESPDFELFVMAVTPELADRCSLSAARRLSVASLGDGVLEPLRSAWVGVANVYDVHSVEAQLSDHFKRIVDHFDPVTALCRRVLDALKANLDAGETEIAQQLLSHPSHVSRTIREQVGVRFVDLRTRLRLMRFVHRVDAGSPLTKAAFESGFGSYSQLHRAFRLAFACSPMDYFGGQRVRVDALVQPNSDAASIIC